MQVLYESVEIGRLQAMQTRSDALALQCRVLAAACIASRLFVPQPRRLRRQRDVLQGHAMDARG